MTSDSIGLTLTHPFFAQPMADKDEDNIYELLPAPVPVLTAFLGEQMLWFVVPDRNNIPTIVPAAHMTYEGMPSNELMALVSMFADGLLTPDELREQYHNLFPREEPQPNDKEGNDTELSDAGDPEAPASS